MADNNFEPTKAEMLAALVTGNASQSHTMATVQRSHRFPLHLFVQMENMAKHADVPVSLVINELIECGFEALIKELPDDVRQKIFTVTKDQMERPSVIERFDSKKHKAVKKRKARAR